MAVEAEDDEVVDVATELLVDDGIDEELLDVIKVDVTDEEDAVAAAEVDEEPMELAIVWLDVVGVLTDEELLAVPSS